MAPEQALGPGASPLEVLLAHREQPPPSLARALGRRDATTRRLDRLIRRMMAKRPEGRPSSMAEVLAALDAVARPAAGRLVVAGLAAVAALLGVLAVPFAIRRGADERPDRPLAPASVASMSRDRDAAAWMLGQGGSCDLVADWDGRLIAPDGGETLPDELFHLLRANFQRFRSGVYGNRDVGDADLARLADLPRLEFLHLGGAKGITGSGLPGLGDLPGLTDLYFVQCGFRDEHVDHLARFPGSRWLASGIRASPTPGWPACRRPARGSEPDDQPHGDHRRRARTPGSPAAPEAALPRREPADHGRGRPAAGRLPAAVAPARRPAPIADPGPGAAGAGGRALLRDLDGRARADESADFGVFGAISRVRGPGAR